MRVALVLIFSLLLLTCKRSGKDNDSPTQDNDQSETTIDDFQSYENHQYNFKLKYPKNWKVEENKVGREWQVINVYKPGDEIQNELPLKVHTSEDFSFISIFPHGYGTELPFGKTSSWADLKVPVSLNFKVQPEESQVLQLNDGEVWSYYLKPENTPGSWYEGFIFAQVAVDSFLVSCHNEVTGDSLSMEECDPLTGDIIKRYGDLNERDEEIINQILASFEFTEKQIERESIANLIKVEKPFPNEKVTFPLEISGKARGPWYFEGDFPIKLVDKDGNVVSEVVASAQGEWMTEDWVPFTATIEGVDLKDNERGYLVFQKDNPSGKPELDREFRLPVLF